MHCKLPNQRNLQNLDVRHEPIKTFVSGLSLQFFPTLFAKKGLILRLKQWCAYRGIFLASRFAFVLAFCAYSCIALAPLIGLFCRLPVGRCRFLEEYESGLRLRRNKIWWFTECRTPYNRPSIMYAEFSPQIFFHF